MSPGSFGSLILDTTIGGKLMLTPVTTLDSRYSDPAATAASWEQTRGAVEAAELFWISTVRADGRPHVTPVVAVWADDAVCFSTGAEEQKFANLRANAVLVTDEAALKRIAAAFTVKWDGRWQWEVGEGCFRHPGGGAAMVFSVRPVKAYAHAKGDPFGATTHRFS
jgi:Pyridoxamine 5'-phosphate oxidase